MADIVITPANVKLVTGNARLRTAAEAITAGQLYYLDSTDGNKAKLVSVDVEATSAIKGIALDDAAIDQPLGGSETIGDVIDCGAVFIASARLVGSSTSPGGVAPEADLGAGDYVGLFGVAKTTNNLEVVLHNSGVAIT